MKNLLLAVVVAFAMFSGTARAVPVLDAGLAPPGTIYGSGNTNDHWSKDVANGAEVALRAILRNVGSIMPDVGTSTYHVPTGVDGSGRALWNWDAAFNACLSANGTQAGAQACPQNNATVSSVFTIMDVVNGSTTFPPMDTRLIPDNVMFGASGKTVGPCIDPTSYTCQNSENEMFLFIKAATDPMFNPFIDNTYFFTYSLYTSGGAQKLAETSMIVIAGNGAPTTTVPEPSSLALLGLGLLGFGFTRNKSKSATAKQPA